jgi:preprotein translocase subunit SecB
LSFEAPNSPGILTETGLEPEFDLNLRTSHRELVGGIFEIVLHVNVHGVDRKRTMFLVELEQAGTFQITGYSPEETRTIVGVTCPNILFPYAREAVSSILTRGSFSQLLLKPIDFAALFERTQASNRAAVTPPADRS